MYWRTCLLLHWWLHIESIKLPIASILRLHYVVSSATGAHTTGACSVMSYLLVPVVLL